MEKILVLGGTQFIGRTLVEWLLATNRYALTLFNRGKTEEGLFPGVPRILGDRNTDVVRQIGEQDWDIVIDVSCYFPASLQGVLSALRPGVRKYIMVSTCSVYDMEATPRPLKAEGDPLCACSPKQAADPDNATYGPRKAECDRILAASGLNHLILRPALVYGPYDHTDRFYYWLHQVAQQDALLLPDNGQPSFSLTYVQDIADLVLKGLHQSFPGSAYNVVSTPLASIGSIVAGSEKALGRSPHKVNAPTEFLHENEVGQWSDMALWIDGDHFTYDNQKMKEELDYQPTDLATGIAQSIPYFQSLGWPTPKFGMAEARRQKLLSQLQDQ